MSTPARVRPVPTLAALATAVLLSGLIAAASAAQPVEIAVRSEINPGLPPRPAGVLRGTPAEAWRGFLAAGADGRFGAAAHLLDLTEVPVTQQREVGLDVARKLFAVVERVGAGGEAVQSDTPEGPIEGGAPLNTVVALRFSREGVAGEVWLRRTRDDTSGEVAWLFTRRTVSSAPVWFEILVEGRRPAVRGGLNDGLGEAPVTVHRESPRASFAGFMTMARRGEFETAAHFLDLDGVRPAEQVERGGMLARKLMLVLVRRGWISAGSVSNDPAGAPESGVPIDEEVLARPTVAGREAPIVMARVHAGELGPVWVFSPETVAGIAALYDEHGYGWIGEVIPRAFFAVSFAGLQLWQWTALLLIIAVGFAVGRVLARVAVSVLSAGARRTTATWDDAVVRTLNGPLGIILWGAILAGVAPWVGLSDSAHAITQMIFRLIILLGFGWLLFRSVDASAGYLKEVAGEENQVAMGFIPILARVGKALIIVLVLLASLDVIGVKVVTVLAGLGLGGLAIAFAAQKTLENLFGAFAIAGDRPFRVGEFVTIGDVTGTVEDVGLRSTRVRTIQRTLVTIPNSAVSSDKVVNFAARDRMLYNPTIGVVYGSSAAQLTYIVDEIRKVLLRHSRIFQEAHRVRFKGFGASSLDIEVFSWIETRDFNEFTAIAEELNFAIARIVESSGTSFAFPSQTVYLSRDGGLDPERQREIAAEVERRREKGELAVPEPSDELRELLRQP
jgi:MscS family membrane protein